MNNNKYRLKIYGVIGDCPALKKILCFIGHNGYYCCWFCYTRGQHIDKKRQYPYEEIVELRNPKKYTEESIVAFETRSNVKGHLGKSILHDLFDLELPRSIVIDYLHVTLLGHTKSLIVSIYNQLSPLQRKIFNDRLKSQKFPHYFGRKLRSLMEFSNVKAVELKNLLFYGLLANLQCLLPLDQLAHLSLYVCSIRLLHIGSPMKNETSRIAYHLLRTFHKDHSQFYTRLENFVLHLHLHYPQMYLNHGALSNIGCFGQEDLIGSIGENHHGTRYFGELVTHYYNIDFKLNNLKKVLITATKEEPKDHAKISFDFLDDVRTFHSQLCNCLDIGNCVMIYRRFCIQQKMFHSLIYYKRQNSVSYFVQYNRSSGHEKNYFGSIKLFFTCNSKAFAVVSNHPMKVLYSDHFRTSKYFGCLRNVLDNFYFVLEKNPIETHLVDINCIKNHCVVIEMKDSLHATIVSAYDEHD